MWDFNYYLSTVFQDAAPKLSGKAPNEVIMGDKYSQTPYGDFWTNSETTFVFFSFKRIQHGQHCENAQGLENRFLGKSKPLNGAILNRVCT